MRRALLLLIAAALTLQACGGDANEAERPNPAQAAEAIDLPPPPRAVPAFVVRTTKAAGAPDVKALEDVPGVKVVAPVATGRVKARTARWRGHVSVAAVPPLAFRPVAPAATRDAEFVWTSLLSGNAVLTFDTARRIDGDKAGVRLQGLELEVGAFADNGVPNIADVLVSDQAGLALGLTDTTVALVGVEPGTKIDGVARRLKSLGVPFKRVLPARPEQVEPAVAPEPVGQTSGSIIGTMRFRILSNGFIDPDDAWVAANITSGTVPILGNTTCHRLMLPQLAGALGEIQSQGLADEIRPGDYGGCYVPRFIDRDPGKPLSMHAFGLAVDINVSTNGLGTRGDMDPRIVAIFEKWGFAWGGRWSRPDPMHFELVRLVE